MSGLLLDSPTVENVFEKGKYRTVLERVDGVDSRCGGGGGGGDRGGIVISVPPPKPVVISMPSEEGEFPVLLLSHGYLLYNSFYSQLIQHIASHGFIVIAPQLYTVAGPDSNEEVKSTAKVINWISKDLQNTLPPKVKANTSKLALAGHSRGGKTSFALALSKDIAATLSTKPGALIGIDPVDGTSQGSQTPPPVLTRVPNSMDLNGLPVLVLGSGLGGSRKGPLFPPCAPMGVSHVDFYGEARAPRWHFVAKEYGHLDMLDDETSGVRGKLTHCLCKSNGGSREPMRSFVSGAIVAFLRGYFDGDFRSLMGIKDHSCELPLEIETVEFET